MIYYLTDDPLDVFHQALALRSTPEKAARLSALARKTAEQNADWERTTVQFEQMLLDMADHY